MPHYIGIDLGGTNIKTGVIDETGKLLAKASTPTRAAEGSKVVVDVMAKAAHDIAQQAGLDISKVNGIGIGSPGPIDFAKGIVLDTPNLPGFRNAPLRDMIADATGRPAVLENDANAAAFGEFWAGAAKDTAIQSIAMLTLGTGVGSGIIIDGEILHGSAGLGGEGGHMILVPNGRLCGCGQRGCLEAYTSASHTARRATEAVADTGQKSSLPRNTDLTSEMVFEHAEQGDALALRIVNETAEYLGIACINLCRLLDPQMIVFAGGMIHAGDFLFDKINAAFRKHAWTVAEDHVAIAPASLGNDAGLIGAGAVAADADRKGRL